NAPSPTSKAGASSTPTTAGHSTPTSAHSRRQPDFTFTNSLMNKTHELPGCRCGADGNGEALEVRGRAGAPGKPDRCLDDQATRPVRLVTSGAPPFPAGQAPRSRAL